MERLREIVLWGDSIMRGVVYDEAKQKYSLASPNGAEAASRVLGIPLRNRARMGCTVDKGLTLIQKDLKTEKEEGEGIEAALLEFGGNDCDFNWGQVAADPEAKHQPRTPLDRFSVHLEEMIRLVRSHGMRPVLVTLPPRSRGALSHLYLSPFQGSGRAEPGPDPVLFGGCPVYLSLA